MTPIRPGALQIFPFPPDYPRSSQFQVYAHGNEVPVLRCDAVDFVLLDFEGPLELEIKGFSAAQHPTLHPLSKAPPLERSGDVLKIQLERPQDLVLQVDGYPVLCLFLGQPELACPDPDAPGVRYFAAGQIHEIGVLNLVEGETLYLEGGAVLRGVVRARNADGVRILGRGLLDGSPFTREHNPARLLMLEGCQDVLIEGLTLVNPSTWMMVLGACERVNVRGVRELGKVVSSDGIDVCGSSDVLIEGCFVLNNDDAFVLKALELSESPHPDPEGLGLDAALSWARDVERITVRGCTVVNGPSGGAMEIGHELQTNYVRDVLFEDIDVVSVHGFGAVASIHNSDWATIERVTYRNIRVEHHYDKFIDFRVIRSMWSAPGERRGHIRNIHFHNVQVTRSIFNPGYTSSLLGGFDPEHRVKNVVFENVRYNGEKVLNADQLELFTRHADELTFL
jgi:hypothetical protein